MVLQRITMPRGPPVSYVQEPTNQAQVPGMVRLPSVQPPLYNGALGPHSAYATGTQPPVVFSQGYPFYLSYLSTLVPPSHQPPMTLQPPMLQAVLPAVSAQAPAASASRLKNKGKTHAKESRAAVQKTRKVTGRKPGARGHSEAEKLILAKAVLKVKPVGGDGWTTVARLYNKKAATFGRPEREQRGLKQKYDQVSMFAFTFYLMA